MRRTAPMTPEQFAERLRAALPSGLRTVTLYGSAAAGDFVPGRSTYNVLVVADRIGMAELDQIAAAVSEWNRDGNEPPLLFTTRQFRSSADTFPIEFSDLQQSRRVLYGEDLMRDVEVPREHLRLELERELKGKLLALRRHYLETRGDSRRIVRLMTRSLSTFLVLARAALRLFQTSVPTNKLEALAELQRHVAFDARPFRAVHELKTAPRTVLRRGRELFDEYYAAVESLVEAIDDVMHPADRVATPKQPSST